MKQKSRTELELAVREFRELLEQLQSVFTRARQLETNAEGGTNGKRPRN